MLAVLCLFVLTAQAVLRPDLNPEKFVDLVTNQVYTIHVDSTRYIVRIDVQVYPPTDGGPPPVLPPMPFPLARLPPNLVPVPPPPVNPPQPVVPPQAAAAAVPPVNIPVLRRLIPQQNPQNRRCPVCMTPPQPGDSRRPRHCPPQHLGCRNCMLQWVNLNDNCPFCRNAV